ncbi:MAG: F0F1 ATP synthase subunit A [Desulfobacteraceae bacterium]|nr:F0F1 ATP synthase subunit A [Desulfobacteraceae bacterium]
MQDLGKIHQIIIDLGFYKMTFNVEVIVMTWIIILGLLFFGYICASKNKKTPHLFQVLGELIVTKLYELTEDAMGKKLARKYSPLIVALFMFLLMCNWIGMIPHMGEPTKDLNTPLSLGLMGFAISHYVGIKTKGFKAYIKEYFEPMFFMMPLNLIGELAKIVSISFRLFGNIMGGSIIIMVVSYLTYSIILPPFLNAFFGIFVGAIQAFVFTMLTIVYISSQAK